jgi:tRNA U34 5-methylaminomethyl-2-thiouridine-forming methyltransferase MnmC
MLQLVHTADGSKTIFNPEIGESYHSRHGALQEGVHVFLNAGLRHFLLDKNKSELRILEVGLGTGLNFLLSANFCVENQLRMDYVGIEAFPLDDSLIRQTGYEQYVSVPLWEWFVEKYVSSITHRVEFNGCTLKTAHCKLLDFQSDKRFDIIYFDAFSAIHQPEMWSDESLKHVCQFLKEGGIFVTYAITGKLKRSLKALGFSIEKVPGAPGKREMLRATKQDA